jgi:hypothetical protein
MKRSKERKRAYEREKRASGYENLAEIRLSKQK